MKYKLMLLPGDGIGPEIMDESLQLLYTVAERFNVEVETETGLIGGASYEKYKTPLTDETLEKCKESDAVLLGAVGGYKWEDLPHGLKPEAALLKLRKELRLWANLRPAKIYSGFTSASSLKNEVVEGTDFIVLRELTGGIYFGQPRGMNDSRGWNTMEYSFEEAERILRLGFETAMNRKGKLISVDKANVLEVSQFWRNICHEVSKDFPMVDVQNMYVDNAAMQIVRDPKQFDVLVTSNLFGDILSDIAGMITGSLGMLPSASLGTKYAMYEPVHGSAPDIAGKNIANPIAMIASVGMLFTHTFQKPEAGWMIEKAIEQTLNQGYRTADIYKQGDRLVNTVQMGELVEKNFIEIYQLQLQDV